MSFSDEVACTGGGSTALLESMVHSIKRHDQIKSSRVGGLGKKNDEGKSEKSEKSVKMLRERRGKASLMIR